MPKIKYIDGHKFHRASIATIELCNSYIGEFLADGYDVTLRQLYYRLVSRGHIPNSDKEYKKLGDLINNARLAGLVDWHHITDRTRYLRGQSHWNDPSEIVAGAAASYRLDRWKDHKHYVEVWVEKDALVGVVGKVSNENDVPFFSCRGYTSQSEMWGAAQRLLNKSVAGRTPVIIHLGDHDPSGVDMTRDIMSRLRLFMGGTEVIRVALNMDQIHKFQPPPNPAKVTDSRYESYIKVHGHESWELDALDPRTLSGLIQMEIDKYKEPEHWKATETAESIGRESLKAASRRWHHVGGLLDIGLTGPEVTTKLTGLEADLTVEKQYHETAARDILILSQQLEEAEHVKREQAGTILGLQSSVAALRTDLESAAAATGTLTTRVAELTKELEEARKK